MIVDLEADTYVSGQTVDPCYKNLTWKRRNIGTSIVISVMDLHQGVLVFVAAILLILTACGEDCLWLFVVLLMIKECKSKKKRTRCWWPPQN